MPNNDLSGVLELYGDAVPELFFERLESELHLPARKRIFSLPLVVWLMISQRLDPKATLSTAAEARCSPANGVLKSIIEDLSAGMASGLKKNLP